MRRAAALLLAMALLGVVAAGCGGDGGGGAPLSKEDYESAMRDLGDELRSTADSLGILDVGPAEPEPIAPSENVRESIEEAMGRVLAVEGVNANGVEIIADLFQEVADGFGEIEPPADVAEAHEKLTAGARDAAKRLQLLVGKLKDNGLSVERLLVELDEATLQSLSSLEEVVDQIKARGYDVEGFGG